MAMAVETRPELVGKRFLCVGGDEPLDLRDIGRWGWRAGVIRAVTHRDNNHSELTVYVEFDDLEWEKREWVKVYEDFQVFLLEQQLVWAKRREGTLLVENPQGTKDKHIQWPALTISTEVFTVGNHHWAVLGEKSKQSHSEPLLRAGCLY
ncbi:probable JmjC domain-containing histone demethylation protein 2C [Oncorhynchus tshawytscha]|uniref:probable JmjC domain-containing histone demethylation protein 2C n=1 Tax=Oncorhynchus tshawytscha TaxID=74940 RepID=UPI001C3E10D7|nr:probable JmjC domain-containing histone demethylation protein 2C [Oncorhynchus tshawytscha]